MVNPVPVSHISTASTRTVMPQTRWIRSTHSAAIARRSADSSAAICPLFGGEGLLLAGLLVQGVERAAAPMPTPMVASEPRAAQVRGPLVMAQVVQPAPTSQEAARVAMVRPALRTRRPADGVADGAGRADGEGPAGGHAGGGAGGGDGEGSGGGGQGAGHGSVTGRPVHTGPLANSGTCCLLGFLSFLVMVSVSP